MLLSALPGPASGTGIDTDRASITLSLATEPPSLDSSLSEDQVSGFVLRATGEGLVRLDRRGRIKPGVATDWVIDGTRAVFTLRRDARFSDGSVVTAHDFVYAWRRLFDPATGASGSTFYAYVFDGANEILKGNRPPEALGVRAIDDFTLDVSLARPITYLPEVLLGSAYLPLKQAFVEAQGDRHGAEASRLLSNGAFKIDTWQHGASLTLSRNPHYWRRDELALNAIDIGYITADTRALLNLYISGEIAALTLDETTLADATNAGLRIRQHRTSCMTQLTLNTRPGRPTASLALRQALQAVFDPEVYVSKVLGNPANQPAYSIFGGHVRGLDGSFQDEFPVRRPVVDRERGKRLVAAAGKALGGTLPTLTLLTAEGAEKRSEYLQGLFKRELGVDVKIDRQTFKQAIVKLIAGDFDIAQSGFCAGTLRDPDYMAGIFESTGTFNDGRFSNAEYDRLLALTRTTTDQAVRMRAFDRLQHILIEEAAILPTHENGAVYVQDPRLRGVRRVPVLSFVDGRIVP